MGGVTARVIGHTTRHVLVVPDEARLSWDRILVATDGSPNSAAAVEHAFSVCKEHGGRVAAISVARTDDEMFALDPEHVSVMIEKARKHLEEIEQRGKADTVEVETFVREGEPYEQIIRVADEIRASIILMGTQGRKGLRRLLMGSVTERTIGYAKCPVMIIH